MCVCFNKTAWLSKDKPFGCIWQIRYVTHVTVNVSGVAETFLKIKFNATSIKVTNGFRDMAFSFRNDARRINHELWKPTDFSDLRKSLWNKRSRVIFRSFSTVLDMWNNEPPYFKCLFKIFVVLFFYFFIQYAYTKKWNIIMQQQILEITKVPKLICMLC